MNMQATTYSSRWSRRFKTLRRHLAGVPAIVLLCFVLLALIIASSIVGPLFVPHGPNDQNLLLRLKPPSVLGGPAGYVFGTDHLGRDILSRTLVALRTSLFIAVLGVLVGFLGGVGLGLISGFCGKGLDNLIMFLVDTQMSIPFTLIALTAVAVFGTELPVLIAVVGIGGWPEFARLTRGEVRAKREMEFIEAERALGASSWRILMRHILPNISSPLIVLSTYKFSQIILLESTLSFLGLGVQPPNASLGLMIGMGRDYLITAWWIAVVPGAVLASIAMVLSILGDWLRDTLDPRLRR